MRNLLLIALIFQIALHREEDPTAVEKEEAVSAQAEMLVRSKKVAHSAPDARSRAARAN